MSFNIEDLFKSIDVIVEQRLADLSYDQTVIATVVDDSDKDAGHYIVSNGTIKFDAYCADAKYKVKDQVRITILNGDWTQKKFISGKYNNDGEESAVAYFSPLDNVYSAPFSKNKVIDSYTLETNSEAQIFAKVIQEGSTDYALQTYGIYDVITLSGDFQTSLGTLVSGGYGVRLDFFIQMEKGSKERYNKFITFDSSEMIGNPYNFTIPTYQEKKIIVNTSGGIIREITLRLYKGISYKDDGSIVENKFIDRDGKEIEGKVTFSNMQLGFGTNLVNVENNRLQVYTKSPVTYGYNDGHPGEAKEIGLVWYNKDENDKYVGFSDGVYDKGYDEINYLRDSYADARLVAQANKNTVADDEASLTIAANWAEAKPIMQSALKMLTSDMAQVIRSFGRQMAGTDFAKKQINSLINSYVDDAGVAQDAKLLSAEIEAENTLNDLDALTRDILQYRYDVQHGVDCTWSSNWDINQEQVNYFKYAVKLGLTAVDDMLNKCEEITSAQGLLAGYRGIYNAYQPKIKVVSENINKLLNKLSIIDGLEAKLASSKGITKDKLISYVSRDLDQHKNKYCIWWYRYNPNYRLDIDSEEYKLANFFGDYWERVAAPGLTDLMFQKGETIDGVAMNAASPTEELVWSRQMDPYSEYEEYKAILFYNHEKFYSDSIIFTNTETDQIPNESKWNAADKLVINHDVYSYDHYQVYSQANDLVNIKDGSLERQLRLSYDGVRSGTEALAAADVVWYIPLNSTLLAYDEEYITKRGYTRITDESSSYKANYAGFYKHLGKNVVTENAVDSCGNPILKPNSDREEYIQQDVISVPENDLIFFYKIKSFYEPAATNNTILVEAKLEDGSEMSSEISFTFSSFGTNGSKYTLAVVPATTQIAVINDQALKLSVTLRDSEGTKIDVSTSDINLDGSLAYGLETRWWDQGPNGIINTDETTNALLTVTSKPGEADKYVGIVQVGVTAILDKESGRKAILSALYPVPYASNVNYFISGPTMIVYNNQGIVSRLSDEPFRLYNELGEVVENQNWSIGYYCENAIITEDKVLAYMPKLNDDNTLRPAPMYYQFKDGKRIVPVATCKVNDEIAWVQPIVITQNNYASSTLNEWDGKFKIDDANGTILSTMVGAGVKDENNSFSGVLMGDIEAGANMDTDNASGIGLYGFHEGAQSFHFGVDGTAFLGKSGRGRICFDGNNGIIKSAAFDENRTPIYDETDSTKIIGYINESTAGMKIDLDDGQIDMRGTIKNNNGTTSGTNSRIKLDVQSPYLEVVSEKGKEIIKVADKEYYLQSDNFEAASFPSPSEDIDADKMGDGQGMKIDLQTGKINAYQLALASKNLLFNAGDNVTDYFAIRDNNGKVIVYFGKNKQFIKSGDFEAPNPDQNYPGMGMRIDFAKGKIESYSNFDLRAGTADTEPWSANIIITSNGANEANPYFKIANNDNKKMMVVTQSDFYLQSPDYNQNNKVGFKFDITHGGIYAYSGFTLDAYKNDNNGQKIGEIIVDTRQSAYPFQIVGNLKQTEKDEQGNNKEVDPYYFKVNWNGGLEARGGTFEGSISASEGTIGGWTIKNSGLYGGYIEAARGKIGGWDINKDSLSGGSGEGSITLAPGGISSPFWSTDAEGKTTLGNLVVENSLTVKNTNLDGITASVSFDGNVEIAGSLNLKANLSLAAGQIIYLGGNQNLGSGHIYSEKNYIYISATNLTLGNTNDKGFITLNGTTTSDYIQFKQTVSCYVDDKWLPGVDGTITYYNSFFGKKQTMTFKKGILVDAPAAVDDVDAPAVSNANKDAFLQSTGTATTWTKLGKMAFVDDIKKKFNISITGKTGGSASTYYKITNTYNSVYKGQKYVYYNTHTNNYIQTNTQPTASSLSAAGVSSYATVTTLSQSLGTLHSVSSVSVGGSTDITLKASNVEVTLEPNEGTAVGTITLDLKAD